MGQQLSINRGCELSTPLFEPTTFHIRRKKIKRNIRVSADSLDGSNMPHSFTYHIKTACMKAACYRMRGWGLCPICHAQVQIDDLTK